MRLVAAFLAGVAVGLAVTIKTAPDWTEWWAAHD